MTSNTLKLAFKKFKYSSKKYSDVKAVLDDVDSCLHDTSKCRAKVLRFQNLQNAFLKGSEMVINFRWFSEGMETVCFALLTHHPHDKW